MDLIENDPQPKVNACDVGPSKEKCATHSKAAKVNKNPKLILKAQCSHAVQQVGKKIGVRIMEGERPMKQVEHSSGGKSKVTNMSKLEAQVWKEYKGKLRHQSLEACVVDNDTLMNDRTIDPCKARLLRPHDPPNPKNRLVGQDIG